MTNLRCLSPIIRRQSFSSCSEWDGARPFQDIPGPKVLPVFGNIWRFLPLIGDLYNLDTTQLHVELKNRFGEIVKLEGIPGKAPLIFLFNPKDVAKVFHSEGSYPERGAMQSTVYYRAHVRPDPYTRVGHLLDEGTQWKKFRTGVNQLLMQQSNIDSYRGAVVDVTNVLVQRLKQTSSHGKKTENLKDDLKKWALEVLGVVGLDHRFGCLEENLSSEAVQIIKAVEDFHKSTYILDMQPFPVWKYITSSSFKRMVSALDHLHSVSEKYVQLAEKNCSKDGLNSILRKIILERKEDGKDVALVLSVDLFIAGVEIMSGLCAVLLYALSRHQKWQEWLADKVCGLPFTQAQPYVVAFIKETMRLWPVAVGSIRKASNDTVLSGYRVIQGSLLVTGHYVMSRDSAYFSDPLLFDPERWLRPASLDFSQFAFAPFGIGSRSCIGRRIAMLEAVIFLMEIVKTFNVEYTEEEALFDSRFLNLIISPSNFEFVDRSLMKDKQA